MVLLLILLLSSSRGITPPRAAVLKQALPLVDVFAPSAVGPLLPVALPPSVLLASSLAAKHIRHEARGRAAIFWRLEATYSWFDPCFQRWLYVPESWWDQVHNSETRRREKVRHRLSFFTFRLPVRIETERLPLGMRNRGGTPSAQVGA